MNLVYYTVGYSREYINVLSLSLASLRRSGYTGDVAVLCDESMVSECKSTLGMDLLYKTFPDSKTPEQASMNKLRIFELPGIERYNRVLFLDSDILVHTDIVPFFDSMVLSGKLYVYTEHTDQNRHMDLMWSLLDYTPSELRRFRENSVHVFNAGCFAFVRDDAMKDHFLAIQYNVTQHTGAYFYEQSFMNAYFNRNEQTDRSLFNDSNYVFPRNDQAYPGYIVHFAGYPGNALTKFQRMIAYTHTYLTT